MPVASDHAALMRGARSSSRADAFGSHLRAGEESLAVIDPLG
jgi:hypothetical protein